MDKSQPSSDRGGESSGNPYARGSKATPVKAKDMTKHAKKELNKAMDKNKAKKMYELADKLSQVDTSKLNEQQLADRTAMIRRLGEELKTMKEGAAAQFSPDQHEKIKNATPQQLGAMAHELAGPGSSYAMYQHELKMLQQAQAELKTMKQGVAEGGEMDEFGDDYYMDLIQDMIDRNRRNMSPSRKLRVFAAVKRDIESNGGIFDIDKFNDAYKQIIDFSRDMYEQGVAEGEPKNDPRDNLDLLDPNAPGNRGMGMNLKDKIKRRVGRDVYGRGRAAAGMPAIHDYANKPHLPEQGAVEARDTGNDLDDTVEDYLDYLEQHGGFDHPTREEEKASIMADIESGALDPDELEYAMSGGDMNEAPEEDLHTSYNIVKMGGALNIDPRSLRMAVARGLQGNPTRTDMMTLSTAFLNLLKNSDDRAIQQFANLIKAGNPRAVPQESTAAIAERNAFVDAMRQVKKGEKFTVGGKEFTKTTTHGEGKVEEAISNEAYDRLKRVFDFSNFKG